MMPRSKEIWTLGEIALLTEWKKVGKTNIQIANRLQRSQAAIENRCKREGLVSRRRWQPAERHIETVAVPKSEVVDLYEKGWRFDGFSHDGLCIMTRERRVQSEPKNAIVISDANNSCTQEASGIMRDELENA